MGDMSEILSICKGDSESILTQPTTFRPCLTKEGSVGLFPVTSSNRRTPKLYTSDFSVALPLCRYSVSKQHVNCIFVSLTFDKWGQVEQILCPLISLTPLFRISFLE